MVEHFAQRKNCLTKAPTLSGWPVSSPLLAARSLRGRGTLLRYTLGYVSSKATV